MREIKYRAWDKSNNKMYYDVERCYDTLSCFGGNTNMIVSSFGEILEDKLQDKDYNDLEENRYEVQQYTGLKDKNGKEIYEGDIVSFMEDSSNPEEVYYKKGCYFPLAVFNTETAIVKLGNKYENPELIKEVIND